MSGFQYLTPCFEWSAKCNLDWAAVSAFGGWVAAIVTFFAVLLPYLHLRAEADARKKADDVEARIAIRNAGVAIAAMFTGLNALHKCLAGVRSFDAAKSGVETVRRHIAPHSMPDFPKSEKYADLRVEVANLGMTIVGLQVYVRALDEGLFDKASAEQFFITASAAIENYEEVIKAIDACVDGVSMAQLLYFGK